MNEKSSQWPVKRLGDIARTASGGTPSRTVANYFGGGIPWVKSGELGDSTVFHTEETITDTGLAHSAAKVFPKGTLCIALYGATVGKLGILGMDAATNQAVCGIFLPPEVDVRFAFRFLEFKRRELIELGKGGAQSNISQEVVRQIKMPVPPWTEQQAVVAEIETQFSRLDASVAALRRAQANLRRYRAAVLKAACEGRLGPTNSASWSVEPLGRRIRRIEAGKSFKCEERPPAADEVGVVKVSAVTWGEYNEQESKTCLDPGRVDERLFVAEGDFLFSRANTIDLVGACVVARTVTKRVMLSDKILRFHFGDDVDPRWVVYFLRSQKGRAEIERLATGNQLSMRNIGQERIRQIELPLPPLTEQERIVAEVERRLSAAEAAEKAVQAGLQRAARLRQAVLARAFSGGGE